MQQPREQQIAESAAPGDALIALGANLPSPFGAPAAGLRHAIVRIEALIGPVTGKSRLYETPCFPAGSGPDYVNAVVAVRTAADPREILENLHQIEAEFRRERHVRWGARTLDLDLLAVGEAVRPDPETQATWRHLSPEAQRRDSPPALVLPHPRLQDRAFVLVPLCDVAPRWRHPLLGRTAADLCAARPQGEVAAVRPLAQGAWPGDG